MLGVLGPNRAFGDREKTGTGAGVLVAEFNRGNPRQRKGGQDLIWEHFLKTHRTNEKTTS